MAYRQVRTPNVNIGAIRGWCLKYIGDGVGATTGRQPTAQRSYEVERANGNIRTSDLPVGLWVPIYFSLSKGPYKGLGHVAWAYNHGNYVEIHDSEVHGGGRGVYTSIAQVLSWFGNHGISYLGWSLWVDGVQIVAEVADARKSNETIADEVLAGHWGNGVDRQNRLKAAGYDYNAVQAIVNARFGGGAPARKSNEQIADEVIAQQWGKGQERKDRLAAAGYDYNAVQAIVNRKLR